jgi:hypothetical protein
MPATVEEPMAAARAAPYRSVSGRASSSLDVLLPGDLSSGHETPPSLRKHLAGIDHEMNNSLPPSFHCALQWRVDPDSRPLDPVGANFQKIAGINSIGPARSRHLANYYFIITKCTTIARLSSDRSPTFIPFFVTTRRRSIP